MYAVDPTKYPLEKVFYFAAGVIPGFAALVIYATAVPGAFAWFFSLGFLGYSAKISLIVLTAFVIGVSLTTILTGVLGSILGVVFALRPVKLSFQHDVAPWRDPLWRTLVRNRLGARAPRDSRLISQVDYEHQLKVPSSLPLEQKIAKNHELAMEMHNVRQDDQDWERWYAHYHEIVLTPNDKDFSLHIRSGLNLNLEANGLYVLVSSFFVPHVRHWWCILPASMWSLFFVAEVFVDYRRRTDQWTTLSAQVKYLTDLQQDPPEADPR